ncbi:MAG TPA: TonB family protein [Gammaproteobacteria bacterium]
MSFWILARDFFERGGAVLLVLGFIIFAMWTLILSRWIYLRREYRADVAPILARWNDREDKDSALAGRIKAQALSSVAFRLNRGLPLIRTLAAVCPLLGLLGTVVGMITIFHMMGAAGESSPRVVAAGVSTAMVTTMAGMVGALSGIFPASMLARRARAHLQNFQSVGARLDQGAASDPPDGLIRYRRQVFAPAGALVITFALVFGMEQMILIGRVALAEPGLRVPVDFMRVERMEQAAARKPKPRKPPQPQQQPQVPSQQASSFESAIRVAGVVAPPSSAPSVAMPGFGTTSVSDLGFGSSTSDFLPIVKVAPIYPPRAALRDLEGWVKVEYTITANGSVKDVVALESSGPIFVRAAIDSAEKYKYRPRIIDGEPVEVTGVTTLIYFNLVDLPDEVSVSQ